jgi:hypothetical protein
MRPRRWKAVLFAGLLFVGAVTAYFLWPESPDQKVARLLTEYQEPAHPPIVASGEVGGLRFTLYEAPQEKEGRPNNGGRESD